MNRKKLTALTLAAALALSLSACGESAAPPQSPTPLETAEADFTFADLQACRFVHASGASGWGTVLTIQPDGSFSGSFSDSEWEESESGTQAVCECCEFSGQLAQPVRVNDYTYSVGIEHIEYQREPGTDEYADGVHYYFTEPRGLEDTEELLIYLPGAPTAELPEGFLGWVMGSDDTAEEELPFYGLYSEARLAGFRGDPVQEPADDPAAAQPAAADPLFSQLKDLEFYFASGAGGWRTVLHIDGYGDFSGTYSDSDMGGSGEDGIWGIQHRCDFTGQFTQPVRVNDYTYSVRIDEIAYEKEAGTEEVIDGTQYCYTDPYGLEDAEDILIYLPGAPLGQLPQEFRSWVGYSENTRDELPFYALNNAVHQQGFSSYDRLESIRDSLEWMEDSAASIKTELTGGTLTQAEQEEWANSLAELWGGALDDLWGCLEQRLDPAELEPLTAEQEAWAAWKEEQVTQAGAGPHEGYPQAVAEDVAAAELTRDRVYELLDWLGET